MTHLEPDRIWQILHQLDRRRLVLCKRMSIVSENKKTGETMFMRPRIWEMRIRDTVSMLELKIRLKLNELDQPTFTIEQPSKQVHPTINKNGRNIPIHGDMLTVKGETEKFHEIKPLRARIAGFAGYPFANLVIETFRRDTPLE